MKVKMSLNDLALTILNAISAKAKEYNLKQASVSFSGAFLLVEAEGVSYKIAIIEETTGQKEFHKG